MTNDHDTCHGYDLEGFLSPGDGKVTRAISSRTTRAMFAGMCLAALIMAALLSKLFLQEVRGLPPGDIEDKVVEYSDRWHQQMSSLKLDLLVAGIRAQVENWQNVTWQDLDCAVGNMVPSLPESGDRTEPSAPDSSCPE